MMTCRVLYAMDLPICGDCLEVKKRKMSNFNHRPANINKDCGCCRQLHWWKRSYFPSISIDVLFHGGWTGGLGDIHILGNTHAHGISLPNHYPLQNDSGFGNQSSAIRQFGISSPTPGARNSLPRICTCHFAIVIPLAGYDSGVSFTETPTP